MNHVTYKIIEHRDGELVLFLHNHGQKLVCEQFRSRNLDAVVTRLKQEMVKRDRFRRAFENYAPVMNRIDDLAEKHPEWKTEVFPENWRDPLEIYGCSGKELEDPELERRELKKLLHEKGPEYVWENRLSLVGQRLFLQNF